MYLEAHISNEPMLPYTMKIVWTITFFGILQKKVSHTCRNNIKVSKWWSNFHFWVKYPFKTRHIWKSVCLELSLHNFMIPFLCPKYFLASLQWNKSQKCSWINKNIHHFNVNRYRVKAIALRQVTSLINTGRKVPTALVSLLQPDQSRQTWCLVSGLLTPESFSFPAGQVQTHWLGSVSFVCLFMHTGTIALYVWVC